jgi:hypothetical protein
LDQQGELSGTSYLVVQLAPPCWAAHGAGLEPIDIRGSALMEKSNPAGDGQLIRNAVLAMQASARRELTIVAEWAERNVIEIGVTHSEWDCL